MQIMKSSISLYIVIFLNITLFIFCFLIISLFFSCFYFPTFLPLSDRRRIVIRRHRHPRFAQGNVSLTRKNRPPHRQIFLSASGRSVCALVLHALFNLIVFFHLWLNDDFSTETKFPELLFYPMIFHIKCRGLRHGF